MAAVTEIGKTYKIIGSNINAHNDYTLPKNLNSQYRGKSKKVAFALKANDDKITIVEMVRRVEEGAPDNKESARFPENAKKVAFEVVKASVEGKEGEYYIWVVYNGVVKVEAFIEEGEQDPEPIDNNSTPDPGPDDDKNKTTPITNEKEQQTSGTEIHVKAGQTVVLKVETGGSVPTPKPCDKKVRIQLVDEQGKKMDSNCYVSFFDQNLVETKVKITKGEGCEDLKEGTYTAIIDNSLEAFSAFKGKLSSEVSLKNLQLIQPGFLYRVRELNSIKTTIYNNTLRYQQNWKAGDSDETSYYKGIYKETHPNLPVRANRSMELGKLLPGEYIRIDQVLFHAKEVKNKGRELPFMAAKISSKVSQKKEWFAWLIYDEGGKEMEKVELASTTVKISGSASLKLKVSPTDILYEKNKGLVVIGNEIANYPKVVEVDWHFPEVESHTKDIREVYYKDPNDNDKNKKKKKKFLGLTYKPGITANFTVKLDKPIIDSHEMPLTVIFQKFELAEGLPEKQVTYTFTLKSTDQETQDNTTYKLKIEKGILFRVFEELKLKLHYSTVSVSAKAGSKVIDSKHQAYPVIQHELFFLPGVFGSELSVNYKDGVEEAWPEFSKQGDKEFELLACDDKGNAHREVDDSELEIFRKVLCIIDIHVENKIISNLLKKDENEFPSIFLDEEKNKELKPVIYQDVPYDWRLIMNNTCNDNPFPFLKRIIDQIKRKREENIRKHVFLDEKINLSGHSTGGVIIQGILSTKNELKDLIKGAFYISTPFYGAPKAEYLYLTGIESGLNFYVIPNSIRQIATNIPITYFLYAKEKLGAYWKLEERKKRILAAEQNGDYSVFPSDLYGWPKGLQRDRLQFNDLLAEKAEKYDEYIKENYPDIPSYLFYSFAEKEDTIYATETSFNGSRFKKKEEFNNSEIISDLNQAKIHNILKSKMGWNGDLKLEKLETVDAEPKQYWQIQHTYHKKIERSMGKGNRKTSVKEVVDFFVVKAQTPLPLLTVYQVNKSDDEDFIKVKKCNNGDGTVPTKSLLGLWHDHRNKNITVFKPIPDGPAHMKSANQPWVWQQVFKVFRQDSLECVSYKKNETPQLKPQTVRGTMVIVVVYEIQGILKPIKNADVIIDGDDKGETEAGGKLFLEDIRDGKYNITVKHEEFESSTAKICFDPTTYEPIIIKLKR